jgi:hypothetical protein
VGGWTPPASPSTYVADLDPAIDRIIMRCLDPDPARRPPSALAVAAALPGGNLLAAVIAAGETPSPDMVAAAGEPGTLTPAVAALCLFGVVAGLVVLSLVLREVSLIGLMNPEQTAQTLTERAHNVVRGLGYTIRQPMKRSGSRPTLTTCATSTSTIDRRDDGASWAIPSGRRCCSGIARALGGSTQSAARRSSRE